MEISKPIRVFFVHKSALTPLQKINKSELGVVSTVAAVAKRKFHKKQPKRVFICKFGSFSACYVILALVQALSAAAVRKTHFLVFEFLLGKYGCLTV